MFEEEMEKFNLLNMEIEKQELKVINNIENTNIITKLFEDKEIRYIIDNITNEPWFVLGDVLNAMGTSTTVTSAKDSINQGFGDGLVNDQPIPDSTGRLQRISVIKKPAITFLVDRSNTEIGMKLRRFIHLELLPEIEKTGQKLKNIVNTLESIELKPDNDYLYIENGEVYTTSVIIARYFDIEHYHLLESIRNKINNLYEMSEDSVNYFLNPVPNNMTERGDPDRRCSSLTIQSKNKLKLFIENNFIECDYLSKQNKLLPQYKLTEMGFNYIILGMNSPKVNFYKIAFIESFFKMRQIIQNRFKAAYLRSVFPTNNGNHQFIYIIKNPFTNLIKIGLSKDVDRGLKDLQTGAGCDLELIYKSMICTNAFEIEGNIHSIFKQYRVHGEWYNYPNIHHIITYIENSSVKLESDFSEIKELCDSVKLENTQLFKKLNP